MSVEVEEAISYLEEEIAEKQEQIRCLREFEALVDAGLSEKAYHTLCETSLRCENVLGEALTVSMPFLKHKRAQPNWHTYEMEGEDFEVRIPNSAIECVEIWVKKYYPCEDKAFDYIERFDNGFRKNELERKVQRAEILLNSRSVIQKAKALFPSYRTWFAVLRYVIKIVTQGRKFKKKCRDMYEFAVTHQQGLLRKIEEEKANAVINRREQQKRLKCCAEKFLHWTAKVKIYENSYSLNPREEFCLEDDEIKVKERDR